MIKDQKPSTEDTQTSNWSFEDGVLSVNHLGKTISLGRYATPEHAAKAAEKYIAGHQPVAE
jgi:hypothetical protein